MAHADFIHLHLHSAYSLAASALILVKDLPKLCKKHHMPAVAITDSGNLFGALEFSMATAGSGIQPIIGCELGLKPPELERSALSRVTVVRPPEPVVL